MSIRAQDFVLYGLLHYGPDAWYEHSPKLSEEMFTDDRARVYQEIAKLSFEGIPVDTVIVAERLDPDISQLPVEIDSSAFVGKESVGAYVQHLRQAYTVEQARQIGANLMDTGDAETARSALLALESGSTTSTKSMKAANADLVDDLQRRIDSGDTGLKTGLTDLDDVLCGIEPSDFTIIAGRPSMGKTALMLNIAASIGVPVGIFSLEMSTAQLMQRLVAAQGVDYGRLRRPQQLQDSDWSSITRATCEIGKKPMWINDSGGMSIGSIEAEAHRMVKSHGVQAIFIDYLQLVTCKAENRLESVSEISRRFKSLAKNLRIAVITLSQLNRSVEKRGKPVPVMSDLRESGQLEQDADQIIFCHRPEVMIDNNRPGEADLIVAKNRGGETKTVTVAWQGRYQRFVDYAAGTPWIPRDAA